MKHAENREAFHNELSNLKEIGHIQSGDNRFSYNETVYTHVKTGDLWIEVSAIDDRGGYVYYERYDEEEEIINIKNRCK